MKPPAKNKGMVSGRWWAILTAPDKLPVLFSSKKDAAANLFCDEYLVEVHVRPVSLFLLARGERELAERRKIERKFGRPRVQAEQKRRRGSVSIKLKGADEMVAELKKMAPAMRRRFAEVMNGELKVIGIDIAKGKDRTALVEAKKGRGGKIKFREVKRAAAPRVRR